MSRTRYMPTQGPFPCYFECGARLSDKFNREASLGWEWTTGYADNCVHFCPRCRIERQYEIAAILRQIQQRPDDFPKVRVPIGRTISERPTTPAVTALKVEGGKP